MSEHRHEMAAWTEDCKVFKCIHCDTFMTATKIQQEKNNYSTELERENKRLREALDDTTELMLDEQEERQAAESRLNRLVKAAERYVPASSGSRNYEAWCEIREAIAEARRGGKMRSVVPSG